MGLELRKYLTRFPDVCQAKFGRTYDFAKLERECEPLRSGKRWLAARDVNRLFEAGSTPLAQYWAAPYKKRIDVVLNQSKIFLGRLPEKPIGPLKSLLSVLHNMGQVSIILRFVHPSRFAIFSTPLINLLQVHGPDAVRLYIAYCEELHRYQGRKTE